MDLGREVPEAHGEKGRVLLKGQGFFQFLVTGIKGDPAAFDVSRNKKRKTLYVVPVQVSQENVEVAGRLRAIGPNVLVPEMPESCAGVAEKESLPIPDFEAGSVRPVGGLGPKRKFFLHKGVDISACVKLLVPRNLKYTAKSPNFHVFEPASQQELVKSVSPLLTQMVQEAGMQVDDRRMSKLQSAFEQRGMINVPGGGKAADVNIKVSGSLSVDW